MASLGKFSCGLDAAMAVVDGKWKPLILWELQDGPKRFNALHRSLTGISQKMLTQHLKELQRHGVVHRESYHEVPPRVEYSMTPASEGLLKPLDRWVIGRPHRPCSVLPSADLTAVVSQPPLGAALRCAGQPRVLDQLRQLGLPDRA